jgi:hypothetical protein
VAGNATNALIENSTIRGANASNQSIEIAAANGGASGATLSHDYVYDCGECVHDDPWTVNDSYVISNGMQNTSDHYEDVYMSDGSFSANHDTLLNPYMQTSVFFGDNHGGSNYGPADNQVSITNSLLAGGGQMITADANSTSVGSSSMDISGNRFARCLTKPLSETGGGNWLCAGGGPNGEDSFGFYPYGGSYDVDTSTWCGANSSQVWSNNVWDDNNQPASC